MAQKSHIKLHKVFLSLGSNIGDRLANLTAAVRKLDALGIEIEVSPVVESDAWGYHDKNKYLNIVVSMETLLDPLALLEELRKIELALGRVKTKPIYEARTLDIDILFYDDQIINLPKLEIPHPRIAFRKFVLLPMSHIAPDFVHPQYDINIAEMLRNSDDKTPTVVIDDKISVHSS